PPVTNALLAGLLVTAGCSTEQRDSELRISLLLLTVSHLRTRCRTRSSNVTALGCNGFVLVNRRDNWHMAWNRCASLPPARQIPGDSRPGGPARLGRLALASTYEYRKRRLAPAARTQ